MRSACDLGLRKRQTNEYLGGHLWSGRKMHRHQSTSQENREQEEASSKMGTPHLHPALGDQYGQRDLRIGQCFFGERQSPVTGYLKADSDSGLYTSSEVVFQHFGESAVFSAGLLFRLRFALGVETELRELRSGLEVGRSINCFLGLVDIHNGTYRDSVDFVS